MRVTLDRREAGLYVDPDEIGFAIEGKVQADLYSQRPRQYGGFGHQWSHGKMGLTAFLARPDASCV